MRLMRLICMCALTLIVAPAIARAQDTPTEREAAREVLKKMDALQRSLDVPAWGGATITAAGPEALTIDALMLRIRDAVSGGGTSGSVLHIPLAPFRELLGLLEPMLLSVLPLTAGQLATFANDGRGEPHPLLDRLPAARTTIAQMLEASGLHDQ